MTVNLSMLAGAGAQFFDNSGVILSGGLVYTYAAGTTTPQATYTTSSGGTAHANPIVLDSAGRVPSGGEVWLTDGVAYKFVLKTSAAVTIATYDNVTGNSNGILSSLAASSGSSLVGFIQSGTGAVATTVQTKLRESVSVLDFGASTASADNTTYIQNALTAATGGEVIIPAGNFTSGAVTIPDGTTLRGAGGTLTSKAGVVNLITLGSNCRVIGLKIVATTTTGSAIYAENEDNSEISGCTISGGVSGTRFAGVGAGVATNFRVINNKITTCSLACVLMEGNVSDGTIVGNNLTSSKIGVEGFGSNATTTAWTASNIIRNVTVSGNTAKTMTDAGFFINRGEKCVFANNVAEDCGDLGFDFEGSRYCSMVGNLAKGCVNGCYSLNYYCRGITMTGNTAIINNATNTYRGFWIASGSGLAADVGYQDINITGNTIEAIHNTAGTLTEGILTSYGVVMEDLVIQDNVMRDCRIYIRPGAKYVRVSNNNIQFETFTGQSSGIGMEGITDFSVENNTLLRAVNDVAIANNQAAIYTVWVNATYSNERYSVKGNRINNWDYSFADDFSGAGRSYARVEWNTVSGELRRSVTSWVGSISNNWLYSNPTTAVTETTY
jgi:hypothetical protein